MCYLCDTLHQRLNGFASCERLLYSAFNGFRALLGHQDRPVSRLLNVVQDRLHLPSRTL